MILIVTAFSYLGSNSERGNRGKFLEALTWLWKLKKRETSCSLLVKLKDKTLDKKDSACLAQMGQGKFKQIEKRKWESFADTIEKDSDLTLCAKV